MMPLQRFGQRQRSAESEAKREEEGKAVVGRAKKKTS